MNYLWEAIVRARMEEIPETCIAFQKAKTYSPYMEISCPCMNQADIEKEEHVVLEVNPYYRFFDIFKELYKPFIETDLLNTLDDIEDYSRVAFDEEKQKSMLSQSNVFLDTSGAYSLPILDKLKGAMTNRIDQIKQNAFMLPIFDEDTTTNPMDQTKPKMKEAIIFY